MAINAGGIEHLRPHVKTHKLVQVLELEMQQGIKKFKAATIAEVEMCAMGGAPDVLLAYQPVGPNVRRVAALAKKYPKTKISCLVDDLSIVAALSAAAVAAGVTIDVFLDVNVGMNRTGIVPGPGAVAVYRALSSSPGLRAGGLHGYDGHMHNTDVNQLESDIAAAFAPFWKMHDELVAAGLPVPLVIAGGTPSSKFHARRPGVEVGAGTTVLWDFGQALVSPDLDFLNAAMMLTRVVSRPTPNRICLDLGHKAVASEMPHPRVKVIGLEDATFVVHSEEHLVLETPRAADYPVGTALYAIPRHICPTMALQSEVFAVRGGRVTETWPVVSRARRITI
jgi:D-serine deaminase-like pyridoxal phosphate-dependent protein